MQAYRIVDWRKWFEVNDKNRAVNPYQAPPPIEKLRKSPLPYIRVQNIGFAQTRTDRKIAEKAWKAGEMSEMSVYGLYIHLLNIAASQVREFRGWILDERQRPLDVKAIAELLGIYEVDCVQHALGILADPDVGLLEVCEYRQTSGDSRRFRENPEIPGTLYNETETEEKTSKTKELRESPENPGNPGIIDNTSSASDFSSDVSASVSATELGKKRNLAVMELAEYIRPHNQSDGTTLRHIVNQLTERVKAGKCTLEIFDVMVETAKECNQIGENPIAMFIEAMKELRFGYVPERKRIVQHSHHQI